MKKLFALIPFFAFLFFGSINLLALTQGDAYDLADTYYENVGISNPTSQQLDEVANILWFAYNEGEDGNNKPADFQLGELQSFQATQVQIDLLNELQAYYYYQGLLNGPNSDSAIAQAYSDGVADGQSVGSNDVFASSMSISHANERLIVNLSNGNTYYFPEIYSQMVNYIPDDSILLNQNTLQSQLGQAFDNGYSDGYAQGQLDSESDTTAVATFVPQVMSLAFGFFFQIFSIEVMGISFLQWFAALAGIGISFVIFKAILK